MAIRIYADFNNQDEEGRVWLNTPGSLPDIERQKDLLHPGSSIVLYTDDNDYIEVPAVLVYHEKYKVWLADWSRYRDDQISSPVSG